MKRHLLPGTRVSIPKHYGDGYGWVEGMSARWESYGGPGPIISYHVRVGETLHLLPAEIVKPVRT